MKNFKDVVKKSFRDHTFIVLALVSFILALIATILIAIHIHVVGFQIYVHYTAYADQGFYSNQWYYLITFASFPFLIWIVNTLVAARIFYQKNKQFALVFQYLTIFILVISLFLSLALLQIVKMQI